MTPLALLAGFSVAQAEVSLVDAVKKSDKATVRVLLKRYDVNAAEADGTRPLHWAARANDVEMAQLLISAGANVKATNRYGVTPLSLAAVNGGAPMIEVLLKAGADPNTVFAEGETVLMTAALTGKVAAVRALLSHGANANAVESWRGQTALMWAASEGNAEAAQALIEHGADVHATSKAGFTPLLFAVREGHIDAVRVLLEGGSSLKEALPGRGGGRRPDGTGASAPETPTGPNALMLAVSNAHYELAAFLLDRGADPNTNSQGWTALHQISWVRKPGLGGNNPAPEGSGNMDALALVRKLVAKGANVNARITRRANVGSTDLNMIGATPFLMAARTADADLMRVLAELGADPLLPNDDGTTPLLVAAGVGTRFPQQEDPGTESEVLEAVKVAFQLGGDINGIDKNGETVMHGAAYKLANSSIQYLVDHGAKIEIWNKVNKQGWTPLNIAQGIVQRDNNTRPPAPSTIAALQKVMSDAGVQAK